MKRVLGILLLAAIGVVAVQLRSDRKSSPVREAAKDSVWYHTSDVALLAKTNRPQLVEFFHPN